ncbi:unnamed protein product [Eruca vesicaria subsp. sativa]|uniref:Uncharacterized protein n=1 Tax=Eruca vesicaria subsp. sativa TaxID=29727 RepID=A0ABC8M978_ERUVS|nr:unnamed protein product [Eruca vesicaria subsp. sativa]
MFACSVLNGEIIVVAGGFTSCRRSISEAEKFLRVLSWDGRWPQGPIAVVEDVVYVLSHGVVYKEEDETWKMVASASEFKAEDWDGDGVFE